MGRLTKGTLSLLLMWMLAACAPSDLAVNSGGLAWCNVDELGYAVDLDDLGGAWNAVIELRLNGVACE